MAFVFEDESAAEKPSTRFVFEPAQEPDLTARIAASMPLSTRIASSLYGVPEAITAVGTGLGASIAGGLRGASSLISGEGFDEATRKIHETQQKYTYQPRTYTGEKLVQAAAVPFELASKGTGYVGGAIGETVGGEQGRIAGESIGGIVPDVAATLYGGVEALRGASRAAQAAQAARAAQLSEIDLVNASKIDAVRKANMYGLKLNPNEADPSIVRKIGTEISRPEDLNFALSEFNDRKLSAIAKRDLELPKDQPLNIESIKEGRAEKGKVYEAVKKIDVIPAEYGDVFRARLAELNNFEGMTPDAAAYMKQNTPQILADFSDLSTKGFNGTDIVNFSRKYRKEANNIYKKDATIGMSVEEAALADAKIGIANALEDMISRRLVDLAKEKPRSIYGGFAKKGEDERKYIARSHLSTEGFNGEDMISRRLVDLAKEKPRSAYGGLAKKWEDARKYIARSHVWENAIDLNTGKVNANTIAKITKKDSAVTGTLKDIGQIAGNFPNSFQVMEKKIPTPTLAEYMSRYGVGGMIGGSIGGLVSGPVGIPLGATIGGALEGISQPIAKGMMMSERVQSGLARKVQP